MANFNQVILVGRFTRDPEVKTFANGGKVVTFGFAVNNSRKNKQTGQWENEPCFVDCEAWNRQTGMQLADIIAEHCRKGGQHLVKGRLKLDQWTDNSGNKRSKLKVVVDELQFLEPRKNENEPASQPRPAFDEDSGPPPPAEDYPSTPNSEIPF